MQHPSTQVRQYSSNSENLRYDAEHDTLTTREHGWIDDDYDDFPSEQVADRPTAHDHVRRLDDGLIWEPHTAYSLYETEDPLTYGAERGYCRPPPPGRGSTRRDRF